MYNWFETKISCEKMGEDGLPKKVKESYLVDALSFTEAEARIQEESRTFGAMGEITVSNIRRVRFTETFLNDNGDRFYKVKVFMIVLDEKSGMEKKSAVNILVQASTLQDAITVVETGMKGFMEDYEIFSVMETAIMDVFPYDLKGKAENLANAGKE